MAPIADDQRMFQPIDYSEDPGDNRSAVRLSSLAPGLKQSLKIYPASDNVETNGFHVKEWSIKASEKALAAINPIRKVTDALKPDPGSKKAIISLAQGDPTVYGHLKAPLNAVQGILDAVNSYDYNGYTHSSGLAETRRAVAEHYNASLPAPVKKLDPESDVWLTSGCGHSLQLALDALCNPGANVLLPRPGFPFYELYCRYLGVEVRFYDLQPGRDWEVDCRQLASLADARTAAVVVCNPGNPSSSVFSRAHLLEIAVTAGRMCVPIIADEVYEGITFKGSEFIPMAAVAGGTPVITVGSISKRYLVPGWRLGWIMLHDVAGHLQRGRVPEALAKLAQFTPPPSSLVAAQKMLRKTPDKFFRDLNANLEASAELAVESVERTHGLSCPSRPQGAMFVMVKLDVAAFCDIADDVDWGAKLLKEESVAVIPGQAFHMPGWVRLVSALPLQVLAEAMARIETFCTRHAVDGVSPESCGDK
eukprot:jgi/Mesen1/4708/ME000241S03746